MALCVGPLDIAMGTVNGSGTYLGPGTCPSGHVFGPQRTDDCLLEVIGFTAASLATLQVGGHGERLAQCSHARLVTLKTIPAQVDGEPCRLPPTTINICRRNQAFMIQKPKRRTSIPIVNSYALTTWAQYNIPLLCNKLEEHIDLSIYLNFFLYCFFVDHLCK